MHTVDQSIAPYHNDHDAAKNYAQVLFRPGVGVQVRELNQLQTLFAEQLRRFGDNVFKQGAIVEGCGVTIHTAIPYVKLADTDTTGQAIDVQSFAGRYAKNAANTTAVIASGINGYQATAPDLNTLYVRYVNSGNTANVTSFAANDVLTIYDPGYGISAIDVVVASGGFSNTDTVDVISPVVVTNTSGGNTFASGLYTGDRLYDGAGSNVAIASILYDGANTVVFVRPLASDLAAANTGAWRNLESNTSLTNANTGQVVNIIAIPGSGASATVKTTSLGQVANVDVITSGSGYVHGATATIVSTSANANQSAALSISPRNYVNTVRVAKSSFSPIGDGYGVTIGAGVIYSAGRFVRTDKQLVIVDKYASAPDQVAVGFNTFESIVTAGEDRSLYDNVTGAPNYKAPGADRLKVSAQAIVIPRSDAGANAQFLSIIEFTGGQPYKLDQQTQYNVIDQTLARRTYEQSGNFVNDRFHVATRGRGIADEPTSFNGVIDPGVAYINGYRVETQRNYVEAIAKATTANTISQISSSVDYGNYIIVESVQGQIDSIVGSIVTLYTDPHTVAAGGAITPAGTAIGSARVRAIVADSRGAQERYRVYLFDISMSLGGVFSAVRSIYKSTFVANISGTPTVYDSGQSAAIFLGPVAAIKAASNVSYTRQKTDWGTITVSTGGVMSLAASNPDAFLTSGVLSRRQLDEIIVTPTANVTANASFSGTYTVVSGNSTMTGSGTAALTDLRPGQYVKVANNTANTVVRIDRIESNTVIRLTSPAAASIAANCFVFYPKNTPVNLISGNVSGGTMSLQATAVLPSTVDVSASVAVRTTVAPSAKAVTRNAVARLNLNTHPDGIVGPWALGHSDIIRLRGVYLGTNTTFTSASAGITDVTESFYVDTNHSEDFLNTGYLFKKTRSSLTLTTSHRLLVVFDVLTGGTTGVRTVSSYPINDALALGSLSAAVNTIELPEVIGTKGVYYDVRDCFDFRPVAANTIAVSTTQSTATINPTEPSYADRFSSVGPVPLPKTAITADVEHYLGRRDRVVVSANGSFSVLAGRPGTQSVAPEPSESVTVDIINIPPYPSLPQALSAEMAEIANTRAANEVNTRQRMRTFMVSTALSTRQIAAEQPRGYTMADIGSIDRRLNAVEYYLSLSVAEQQVKNRIIPSANDSSADRFKYGFFADSFLDARYSEVDSPQYYATVIDGRLVPKVIHTTIEMRNASEAHSLPYNDHVLVSQLTATDGAVVVATPEPEAPQPPAPPVVYPLPTLPIDFPLPETVVIQQPEETTVIAATQRVRIDQSNFSTSENGQVADFAEFTMSSVAGQVEIYIDFLDHQFAFEVFQGHGENFNVDSQTPLFNSLNVTEVTAEEFAAKRGSLPGEYTSFKPLSDRATLVTSTVNGFETYTARSLPVFSNMGKLIFTHDPSRGRHYRIYVTKFRKNASTTTQAGRFNYVIYYPTDALATIRPISLPSTFDYKGKMVFDNPNFFIMSVFIPYNKATYYAEEQTFDITVYGLKPLTQHTLTIDGIDLPQACQPVGGSVGDPLVSDSSGQLKFKVFYKPTATTASSALDTFYHIASLTLDEKVFRITSSDGKSVAAASVSIKDYASVVRGYFLPPPETERLDGGSGMYNPGPGGPNAPRVPFHGWYQER